MLPEIDEQVIVDDRVSDTSALRNITDKLRAIHRRHRNVPDEPKLAQCEPFPADVPLL
jgi:hypothetical protein